jgi:hypothetical protein
MPRSYGRRREDDLTWRIVRFGLFAAVVFGIGLMLPPGSGCGGGRSGHANCHPPPDPALRRRPVPVVYATPDQWWCERRPVSIACGPVRAGLEPTPVVIAWYPEPGLPGPPPADLGEDQAVVLAGQDGARALTPVRRTTFAREPAVTYDLTYRDDQDAWDQRVTTLRTPAGVPVRLSVTAAAGTLDEVAATPEVREILASVAFAPWPP